MNQPLLVSDGSLYRFNRVLNLNKHRTPPFPFFGFARTGQFGGERSPIINQFLHGFGKHLTALEIGSTPLVT